MSRSAQGPPKAAGVMAKLNKRVWINDLLSEKTKLQVYRSCVLSTLLYGSESWPTYARQEKRLNGFHLRCLRRLFQIKWQDRVSNTNALQRADMPSIPTLLIQRRLRWLGHVHRMEPDSLPRQVLYGELWEGARRVGRHSFALRMFASVICDSLNSIPIPGRSSRKTAPPGVTV